jgi:hypothetical protein
MGVYGKLTRKAETNAIPPLPPKTRKPTAMSKIVIFGIEQNAELAHYYQTRDFPPRSRCVLRR